MDVVGRRFPISVLLVVVAFLALTSISPASAALSTALSTVLGTATPAATVTYAHTAQNPTATYAHTWRTAQDPTVTYAHTYAHTAQNPTATYAHTWRTAQDPTVTYAHTWRTTQNPSTTYSHTWDATWSRSWSQTWSRTWSTTWSRRTHVYPTYTQTEYVPIPVQVPGCDPYDPSCYGYNGYYPTPNPGCDPTNPYCNSYPTPSYPPTQPPIVACDPNNPYCNGSLALQTMTAYPPTPQTVVVAQPPPQTMTDQPVPQTVPVTQPQTQDFTLIAIAIIAAVAAGILLMSRRHGSTTVAQPGQVASSTQIRPLTQPGLQFCTTCGRQIALNSRFCGHCGSAQ